MNIEIFPAEKTCEQGCASCPLARKDREVTVNHIDKQVQRSFSILERVLKADNTQYDLHFTSSLHLFPKLSYPELINMSRFETRKDIGLNGNVRHFSDNVRTVLRDNSIDPNVIGFSIVPQSPVVSENDTQLIRQLIDEFRTWYFVSKNKALEVTVRSNLITIPLFKKVSSKLFDADLFHLKKVIEEYAGFCVYKEKPVLGEVVGTHVYYNEYSGEIGDQKITITNRVIADQKVFDREKNNIEQAESLYPRDLHSADCAIAPKGVMLEHTSSAINNPVLWMSHEDFRTAILKESAKHDFSILRFIQKTLTENIVMYKVLLKNKKDNVRITNDDFMSVFEQWRPQFPE